ncbi:CpaF family protein [Thermaurantiacus tibetensis]|uniref:CpaF family protein n=1 Tax=Thermaurantiacus tibetensis TaxID=2759035 RepID=UPI002E29703B|nr:CpaF family protein [Thermaurantiacus tibetensis]
MKGRFGRKAPAGAAAAGASAAPGPLPAPPAPARARPVLMRRGLARVSQEAARALVQPAIARSFDPATDGTRPRGELAAAIGARIDAALEAEGVTVEPKDRRELVTHFLNGLIGASRLMSAPPPSAGEEAETAAERAHRLVLEAVLDRIDSQAAAAMNRGELARRLGELVGPILAERGLALNAEETRDLVRLLIDDMLGLGPLEPFLADDTVTDIMANGPKAIWVERHGRLEKTRARFRDQAHMMAIISRIVTSVGRRVDEASPLVDARLADGSRVNIIIPPLALDGPAISIRKFARRTIDLDRMVAQGNMSREMATLLKIAARIRLNILVSGGTGSGKTTLLNALSRMIAPDERIVTIEDAAELQLQQPHVVRLETRPPNLEGRGEVTMRDLVRNALRMRPDRIIVGEIRGAEAIDMLQAMNTGHDGSLGTIHANRPREALTRLENMVAMAGFQLPSHAVRAQIASAVNLIVQIARMKDGVRRVTSITEVTGIEGDVITLQELFAFRQEAAPEDGSGREVVGRFVATGLRPQFAARAEQAGLGALLAEALA